MDKRKIVKGLVTIGLGVATLVTRSELVAFFAFVWYCATHHWS